MRIRMGRAPRPRTSHYDVRARDLVAAASAMSARGCWGRYDSNHNYEFDTSNDTVTLVTVTARPAIELPRWAGYRAATDDQRAEWDRMLAVLTRHEARHHQRFVEKWNRFKRRLQRLSAPVTEDALADAWDRFDGECDTAQRDYDRSTQNGQSEGVRLDEPAPAGA